MNINHFRDFDIDDEKLFFSMAQWFYQSDSAYNGVDQKVLRNTFTSCVNKSPFIRGIFLCCDNEVCGYTLLTFTYSNEYGGKIMEIDEIYIIDKFRKKGLASYFISKIITDYKNEVACIEVVVKKENEIALNLF